MDKITVATLIEALGLIVSQSPEVAEYAVELHERSNSGYLIDMFVDPASKKLILFSESQE